LLTCKDFLSELSDYLDDKTDAELRANIEKHITECPNCWVVCDTTRKTIEFYKGHERTCCIPSDVQSRLMSALERKLADKKPADKKAAPAIVAEEKRDAEKERRQATVQGVSSHNRPV
jgi:hypothetical protein